MGMYVHIYMGTYDCVVMDVFYILGLDLGINRQPAPYLLQALDLLSKFLVYPAKKRMSATDVGLFLVKRNHVCVYVCVCCLLYTSPSPRDS